MVPREIEFVEGHGFFVPYWLVETLGRDKVNEIVEDLMDGKEFKKSLVGRLAADNSQNIEHQQEPREGEQTNERESSEWH